MESKEKARKAGFGLHIRKHILQSHCFLILREKNYL